MSTLAPNRPEPPSRDAAAKAEPGPLGRIARVAYRRRGRVLLAWLAALAIAVGLSVAFGGDFNADYSAPGSDSSAAQDLLENRFPSESGATIDFVVRADGGVEAAKSAVDGLLAEMKGLPHVAGVPDPYTTPGSISPDGRTLVTQIRLDVTNPDDMPVADTQRLLDAAKAASTDGLTVALGGQPVQQAEQGEVGSEMIGLLAAALILLITFGTVVAAGLPILVAVAGLAVSSMLTGVLLLLVDAPDWSTSLATMMGIGIGIDYVLLMVTRFREWRTAGLDPEAATVATLDTAGRAVLVAGGSVMVSMLGLFAMGLSFMRGASLVTILAVFVVMVASMTLFPALLGYLGRHVDRLRLPIGRRRTEVAVNGHVEPSRGWLAWSGLIERHRLLAAGAGVAILLALAAPFLGVRFGFPDAGNAQAETSGRQAYDMQTAAFGPGANGPLVLVMENPTDAALTRLSQAVKDTTGVAAVAPARLNPAGDTAVVVVIPTTGPQAAGTEDLVHRLRDDVIPGTGSNAYVGGLTATSIDSTENVADKLPLLVGGVVLLSMLLLLVAFRSVAVALKAAAMNLLSVAAAYGVVAYVLQGGWAGQLIGIDTETPLPSFVPVLMFAVLFGLSMDYEVFLVSRMREAWVRTGDNRRAVTEGLAGTGRVITAAAAIMIAVFAAFVPSPDVILKVIGVGMAAAILIDATVVRLLLVPAVMHILGKANWWMPGWLAKRLPEFNVEGRPQDHLPVAEKEPALV
ncbi:MMPL family transporter [Virgisporangium aurantiacum]|uniref:Membrane protein n=1 Tax=Virgisporangium aurantiacum TaxID=175570 RepID=A0A8J3ZEX8_9ACTN|nr:MMPL family transporter [Virgisporangium aurantiacum]GIJ60540.1 membrane protein [Virgisporangium aurantiacum]